MNIAQAKQIPLTDVLTRLGREPAKTQGDDIWYQSPFRDEQDASFKINRRMNVWYDHGEGKGGSIIELIKNFYRLPDVAATLGKIRELMGEARSLELPAKRPAAEPVEANNGIEITNVKPISSKSLLAYLGKRGIDAKLAAPFIKQVHYKAKGKDYFAIGFGNDAGGFELRNPYFKGSSSKDLTTIEGKEKSESYRVIIFEGFFDFLTAITISGGSLNGTAIILNSVGTKDKAVDKIRSIDPKSIELYRDNDAAGQSLLTFLKQELPDATIIDKAQSYQDFDDLNHWHTKQKSLSPA